MYRLLRTFLHLKNKQTNATAVSRKMAVKAYRCNYKCRVQIIDGDEDYQDKYCAFSQIRFCQFKGIYLR